MPSDTAERDLVEHIAREICVYHGINPDHMVAYGAAQMASVPGSQVILLPPEARQMPMWVAYETTARAALDAIRKLTRERPSKEAAPQQAAARTLVDASSPDVPKILRTLASQQQKTEA